MLPEVGDAEDAVGAIERPREAVDVVEVCGDDLGGFTFRVVEDLAAGRPDGIYDLVDEGLEQESA